MATPYKTPIKTTVTNIVTVALMTRRTVDDLPVGPKTLRNVLQKTRV